MTKEQSFFLQVIRDHVHKERTAWADGINMNDIRLYAKRHQVEGIFYYQTKKPEFRSAYSATLYFNTNRKAYIRELLSELRHQRIDYFIIKGTEVAGLYPIPELRTMGDTDLVVHEQDRERVHDILLHQGYENASKYEDREWQYYINGMEFEIHDHLIYKEAVNNSRQEDFFNDYWKYVNDDRLDWNFHFLFLVCHLRKHFMNSGVGFRQFMDLAVLIRNVDLDWAWIEKTAEEIELFSFLKVVLSFCSKWFDISVPIALPTLEEAFYTASTEKIFDDGVFGFGNPENERSAAINVNRKSGKTGMIQSAIRQVFPSYKTLCTVPHYSFIQGKPFLLPFVWIYRMIIKRKKSKAVVDRINKSFASSDQIKKREELYRQWGL